MASIYLLRHGKASFGSADYDRLDPLGVQQAERLGQALADSGLHDPLFFSGSQRRHQATLGACMAALGAGATITLDARWNEFDHEAVLAATYPSEWPTLRDTLTREADPSRAFQRLFVPAMSRWIEGRHDADYAETWTAFTRRVRAALATVVVAVADGRDALVATSGGPIAAVMQQLLGLDDMRTLALNGVIANASFTRLLAGRRLQLASFNVHAHLQQAGADLLSYR